MTNKIANGCSMFVLAASLLSGCAAISARNRSDAEMAKRESSVTQDSAAIRMRAAESARSAYFQISTNPSPCEGFNDLGVALSGRSSDEKLPKDIVEIVPAEAPVQVRGFWMTMTDRQKLSCGPVVRQFTPMPSVRYLVVFESKANRCTLAIVENGPAPRHVESSSIRCARTLGEIF